MVKVAQVLLVEKWKNETNRKQWIFDIIFNLVSPLKITGIEIKVYRRCGKRGEGSTLGFLFFFSADKKMEIRGPHFGEQKG